ncbi:hypothetical protein [Jannaschia pohangensis]|uniref:Uncharacterized protein n=1 Tax=Jannaschia pohangensis TaxID=390807 RepID=A0A1I3TJ78_9RHOB|nr:hypothetical protein [Jannaschia pohangensis]SFJ70469.1 hypothetical protein SAMN04488095_3451 [Jannaschia pohangensis]
MGRLLTNATVTCALAALILVLTLLKGPAMAQNLDHGYYARISTLNVAWSLRVNDMFVRENGQVDLASSNGSIATEVQPGQNTLSLLFSPLTGRDPVTGEFQFELRDGVEIEIAIDRLDFATRAVQFVDAVHLRYDATEGAFVDVATTMVGTDRILSQPLIRSDGKYRLSELAPDKPFVLRSGQKIGGFRLDVDFTLDDDAIPPFHWSEDAVQLRDTPEMRAELLLAYQGIHGLIARGDGEAVLKASEAVWTRMAKVLTSQPDARAFVEASDQGLARFAPTRPDGAILQPLKFLTELQDVSLQFMADNRLVRIRPDPIAWELLPEGSNRYDQFPVVFYRNANGDWLIGAITTGL